MSQLPIEAVILGLDAAKEVSGAGLLLPDYGGMNEEEHPFQGQYYLSEFGKVVSHPERARFVEALIDSALEYDLTPVIVAEEWDPPVHRRTKLANGEWGVVLDPRWNPKTIFGMGVGWGKWEAEIESAADYLKEEHGIDLILWRATPNVWREALWGHRRPKSSEENKAMACNFFESVFGYKASSDISEAGCMALYGAHCQGIADILEANQQKRAAEEAAKKKATKKKKSSKKASKKKGRKRA
jgi:hypothetical protein